MKYFIRLRGRAQGPLDADQIRRLGKRGRFNRLYEVSTDRKSWRPADEFPELFANSRPQEMPFDDVPAGQNSIFDDEDPGLDPEPAPVRAPQAAARPAPRSRASAFDDDEDDAGDWDEDDWDDEGYEGGGIGGWIGGVVEGLFGGIVAQPVLSAALAIGVTAGLCLVFLSGEGWELDQEAYDTLTSLSHEIDMQNASDQGTAAWMTFGENVNKQLSPIVSRLEASSAPDDHLRQELLFAARDDVPAMMSELPVGQDRSKKRFLNRLAQAKQMLDAKSRQRLSAGSAAATPSRLPVMGQNADSGMPAPGDDPGAANPGAANPGAASPGAANPAPGSSGPGIPNAGYPPGSSPGTGGTGGLNQTPGLPPR